MGMKVKLKTVDTSNKPKELFSFNPSGTVPVLILPGGDVLNNSSKILDYIRQASMRGSLDFDHPSTQFLHVFADKTLGAGTRDWIFNYRDRLPTKRDHEQLANARTVWLSSLQRLEDAIESKDWFLGVGPNIAVCALIPRLALGLKYGLDGLAAYSRLNAWFEGVQVSDMYLDTAPDSFIKDQGESVDGQ